MLRGLKQFNLPEIEEKVLKFWKENQIFEKSLKNREGKKPFRFFEGPPTANGKPGTHHILTRAFKDIMLRYKTMQGHYVLRRAGWDTHGLPVELEVEKELGIKNKQEIEKFGIAEFNARAKMSVWKYKSEWERLTERVGFWLDFEKAYVTYDNSYIETLWWVFSEINKRGLLKKLYKVVPWCPRCQTPLSSHELGQPGAYKLTKDPSVFVKFKLKPSFDKSSKGKSKGKEFLLIWTTTPWTLPANVAVAVNPKLTYTKYKVGDEYLWSYNVPPKTEGKEPEVVEKMSGKKLVGKKYELLYGKSEGEVLAGDFVSTEEGTGLVHIAPAFGEDDLRVAGDRDIPLTIDDQGKMKKGFPGSGKFIKEADSDIIKDLEKRGLLYGAGTIEHEYPFCWRCSNPLIYFARFSWFIEMSKLRDDLLSANEKINWKPSHIKEGRFGEWLKEIKDWSISRDRYWGTPLPIWNHPDKSSKCDEVLVIGGLEGLNKYAYHKNKFFIARHVESDHNVKNFVASGPEKGKNISRPTAKGIEQGKKLGKELKKKNIDLIVCSPYLRTTETAKLIAKETGAKIVIDKRLSELNTGIFNGRPVEEHHRFFRNLMERFIKTPPGGENWVDAQRRMVEAVKDLNDKYDGKNILIVGHGDPLWVLDRTIRGMKREEIEKISYVEVGEYKELPVGNWPFNMDGELDVHRPFVDNIALKCPKCAEKMVRVKEVADVWFDSGAMPFAEWHYPFENKKIIDKGEHFPADYITEAIDQTRGWFYTLLAVSTLLKQGAPYLNVISLGLLLDKNGQKMSKSKGNVVDPWQMIQKYGADVLRWYFYTVNDPGEPKKFDENDLAKVKNRLHNLVYNSYVFLATHCRRIPAGKFKGLTLLDKWILSRLHQTIGEVTKLLDEYDIGSAAKAIEVLIDDLSRWYIRRSRKRPESLPVLGKVLLKISKLAAPFNPFFSEALYVSLKDMGAQTSEDADNVQSVHLTNWPKAIKEEIDEKLVKQMSQIRYWASLVLAKRAEAGIKVRQPLSKLKIKNEKLKTADKELLSILADEVNVKEVVFDNKIKGEVELDTKITPELRNEGIMRELVRMAQGLRHDAGYRPGEKIVLMAEFPKDLLDVVNANLNDFKESVSAKSVIFKKEKFDAELNTKLDNWDIWMWVRKF
ncbi:MAG: class I tRNA ligase family protein [Patescibacteria group bacterium]